MKVRAISLGYYGERRRYPGEVFEIKTEKEFSRNWMEKVSEDTPVKEAKPEKITLDHPVASHMEIPHKRK